MHYHRIKKTVGKMEYRFLAPHLKTGRHTVNNSLPVRQQAGPGWAEMNKTYVCPSCVLDLKDKNKGTFLEKPSPNP
jgi:hypothetical protein